MTERATTSHLPPPRLPSARLGWRDLVAALLALLAGTILAELFAAWSRALEDRFGVPGLDELPAVLAITAGLLAAYALWRLAAHRASPLSHARIAERLRTALEQARAAEERAEASQRRLIEAIE